MITNIGKGILAKYLIGQAPSFASYIAVGCGPSAIDAETGSFEDYALKTSLDFEMFRVPIISKGYVNENNLTKLVLTAELPTEERYEITEVGIFSADSNPSAGTFDSKNFFLFTQAEGWKYLESTKIESVYTALDTETSNVIDVKDGLGTPRPVFHTNADNRIFTDDGRVALNERSRFLNNMIMIIGNNSILQENSTEGLVPTSSSNYIKKTDSSFSFNKNAPTDKIKLAFSVINKNGNSATVPDNVKILVRFSSTASSEEYASFTVDIDHGTGPGQKNFALNRYFVVEKEIQDLYYTSGFNWDTANLAKIYAQVTKDGVGSPNYYVALDGMRLENLTTTNPLYGMTGYSVLKTDEGLPVVKAANTSNYIEFRIAIGVE